VFAVVDGLLVDLDLAGQSRRVSMPGRQVADGGRRDVEDNPFFQFRDTGGAKLETRAFSHGGTPVLVVQRSTMEWKHRPAARSHDQPASQHVSKCR
jgi:hypothetical protein